MTDQEYKQLAQLVTYLLESEDWKCIWINEYAEPIRLFMFKTGLTFRRTKKYIDEALNKLLGPIYYKTQNELRSRAGKQGDLYFKPKPMYKKNPPTGKTITPSSEFGKKYVAHYGYGAMKDKAQYYRERKIYLETGRCSWE